MPQPTRGQWPGIIGGLLLGELGAIPAAGWDVANGGQTGMGRSGNGGQTGMGRSEMVDRPGWDVAKMVVRPGWDVNGGQTGMGRNENGGQTSVARIALYLLALAGGRPIEVDQPLLALKPMYAHSAGCLSGCAI